MSPTIARRLGACVKSSTKLHHALCMSTTALRWQNVPSDHYNEHLDRLTLLQAEDLRKLKTVKVKIAEYDAALSKGLDFLTTLPAALEPLKNMRDTAYTNVERAIAITEAQAQLRKLKDATLPNLLAHVEDLELEPFPEPASGEEEIEFLQRARGMNEAERKDLLDSLNLEMRAAISQVTESVQGLKSKSDETSGSGSDAESAVVIERMENPFAKVAAKAAVFAGTGKRKAEERPKFGMSTDDQFASVIADAAPRKEVFKKEKVMGKNFGLGQNSGEITTWKPDVVVQPKPKPVEPRVFSHRSEEGDKPRPAATVRDLNSLQAQLEASFKR